VSEITLNVMAGCTGGKVEATNMESGCRNL